GSACLLIAAATNAPGALISGFVTPNGVGPAELKKHVPSPRGSFVGPSADSSIAGPSSGFHDVRLIVHPTAMSDCCEAGTFTVPPRMARSKRGPTETSDPRSPEPVTQSSASPCPRKITANVESSAHAPSHAMTALFESALMVVLSETI